MPINETINKSTKAVNPQLNQAQPAYNQSVNKIANAALRSSSRNLSSPASIGSVSSSIGNQSFANSSGSSTITGYSNDISSDYQSSANSSDSSTLADYSNDIPSDSEGDCSVQRTHSHSNRVEFNLILQEKHVMEIAKAAGIDSISAKAIASHINPNKIQNKQIINIIGNKFFYINEDTVCVISRQLGRGHYSTAYSGALIQSLPNGQVSIEPICIKMLNDHISNKHVYKDSARKRAGLGQSPFLQEPPKYVDTVDGIPFIIEKFYAGKDMNKLKFDGKEDFPLSVLGDIAKVARGVSFIHKQDQIHTDLKADNLFIGGIFAELDTICSDSPGDMKDFRIGAIYDSETPDTMSPSNKKSFHLGNMLFVDKATIASKELVQHGLNQLRPVYQLTQKQDRYALGIILLESSYAILDEAMRQVKDYPEFAADKSIIANADPRIFKNDNLKETLKRIPHMEDRAILRHNRLLQDFNNPKLIQAIGRLNDNGGFHNQPDGLEVIRKLFDMGYQLIDENPDKRPSATHVAKELNSLNGKLKSRQISALKSKIYE